MCICSHICSCTHPGQRHRHKIHSAPPKVQRHQLTASTEYQQRTAWRTSTNTFIRDLRITAHKRRPESKASQWNWSHVVEDSTGYGRSKTWVEEMDREDPHTWLAAAKSNSKSMKAKHPDCQLSFLSPPTTSYHQGKHQPEELSSLRKGSVNTSKRERGICNTSPTGVTVTSQNQMYFNIYLQCIYWLTLSHSCLKKMQMGTCG